MKQTTQSRKEFFVARLNETIKEKRGCDPHSEEYIRLDGSEKLHWSRGWGETLYRLTHYEGMVDWVDIDMDDSAQVATLCEDVVETFHHYTVEDLEEWFRTRTEVICGELCVCGYRLNAMEALRLCDPVAWREEFFNWLDEGVMDVSSYEGVGE